jgi:Cache domain
MIRKAIFGLATAVAVSGAALTPVLAQTQFGTAPEAKAMLDKAVAAVKADKAKAIATFLAGTDGFKDRDLYPFCFNTGDGVTVAGPASVLGKDVRTIKDPTGKTFGEDLYKAAVEGKVTEVNYMFPRPGQTEPSAKISFVTKAGDLGCGVGYYK